MKALLILVFGSITLIESSSATIPPGSSGKKGTENSSINFQEMFNYFRAHRQGKGISLNWSITSSFGVSGFTIERSYVGDFVDVEIINQMNLGFGLRYSWKDESVFPGIIYYRIGCVMNNGAIHYSAVESVRIVQH